MSADPLGETFDQMRSLLGTTSEGSRVPDVFSSHLPANGSRPSALGQFLAPDQVRNTVADIGKRNGISEPRVAASMVITLVMRAALWQSVATHLLLDRAVVVRFDNLRVGVGTAGTLSSARLCAADIAVGHGDSLRENGATSVLLLDSSTSRWKLIHDSLNELRLQLEARMKVVGRMPGRLLDGNVATIWMAIARHCAGVTGSRIPVIDQLPEQWAANPRLIQAIRTLTVKTPSGGTRIFAARRSCCLEYQRVGQPEPHFCGGCPLIKTESIIRHREAIDRGEKPEPLGNRDRI